MSLLVHSCKSFLFPITEKWNFWVIGSTLAFVPSTQLNTLVKFTRDLHRARWVIFCSHYAWFLNSFQLSFSFLGISAQVRTAESADIAHIPMVAPPWSILPAPPNTLYPTSQHLSSLESFLSPFFFFSLSILSLGELIHFHDSKCYLFVLDPDFIGPQLSSLNSSCMINCLDYSVISNLICLRGNFFFSHISYNTPDFLILINRLPVFQLLQPEALMPMNCWFYL